MIARMFKGQLISKCLFSVFHFFQKTNKNKLTWGIIVVKPNLSVHFYEELSAWKNYYDFVLPLVSVYLLAALKILVVWIWGFVQLVFDFLFTKNNLSLASTDQISLTSWWPGLLNCHSKPIKGRPLDLLLLTDIICICNYDGSTHSKANEKEFIVLQLYDPRNLGMYSHYCIIKLI